MFPKGMEHGSDCGGARGNNELSLGSMGQGSMQVEMPRNELGIRSVVRKTGWSCRKEPQSHQCRDSS